MRVHRWSRNDGPWRRRQLALEGLEARLLLAVSPAWFERVGVPSQPTPENTVDIDWQGNVIPAVRDEWMVEINIETLNMLGDNPVPELEMLLAPFGIAVLAGNGNEGWVYVNASSSDVPTVTGLFEMTGLVENFEPNAVMQTTVVPNDTNFGDLWGLNNTGQVVPGLGAGTPDADIDAPEAWDKQTGSGSVVVAVIDTGIDFSHPDLGAQYLDESGEIPGDNLDNDGNFPFVDDVRGWDFVNWDNDPSDDNLHGTHVSGTIGAAGNNGLGVTGVAWDVSILPIKALNAFGTGTVGWLSSAINYATTLRAVNGISDLVATNNSWGGRGLSLAIQAAVTTNQNAGMLYVAAAGNNSMNIDVAGQQVTAASFANNNIISVAATDNDDVLGSFSNFGVTNVDLASPGVRILSTVPGGGYQRLDGTSMAAPHVAGTAALLWSFDRTLPYQTVRDCILNTVDPIASLSGLVATGGRLNAHQAVMCVAGDVWIEGTKFDDLNGDGLRQSWEPGLAGWTIYIDANNDGQLNLGERSTVTDAAGQYWLVDVPQGVHTVREVAQTGWVSTTPAPPPIVVDASTSGAITGIDFGNFQLIDICGSKFDDLNRNGLWDDGEPTVPGWIVYLDQNNNGQLDAGELTAVTDANGEYCFEDLGPGTYVVREVLQDNWVATFGQDGHVIEAKSGVNPTTAPCYDARPLFDGAPYPGFTGQVAVASCFAEATNEFVLGVVETNSAGPAFAVVPMYHHGSWNRTQLGDVFGLALDDFGNIYTTASAIYNGGFGGSDAFGFGGSGAVYKINRRSGAISLFATLPNQAGMGLGNIAFDGANQQFFVSNIEDGRIYRVDLAGTTLEAFHHGTNVITTYNSNDPNVLRDPSDTPGVPAALGTRVWGLQAHEGRLYYGLWNEDAGNQSATVANEVWSVALAAGGGFSPRGATPDISLPSLPAPAVYSNPVSDISFSRAGSMLLSERGMGSFGFTTPHEARDLEYVNPGSGWVLNHQYPVGAFGSNTNSAGGGDYDDSIGGRVWMTGDALTANLFVYGLQGTPVGRALPQSLFIDLNNIAGSFDKTEIGDVEVPCRPGVNFGNYQTSSLHGQKWEDLDDDGVKDPNEVGLDGWVIALTDPASGNVLDLQPTHEMDLNGDGIIDPRTEKGLYWFEDVPPGAYRISEISTRPGWHQSYPASPSHHDVVLALGQRIEGLDFGNNRDTGSIHGFKFLDLDGDGMYDPNVDEPLPGIKISLFGDSDGDGTNELTLTHTNEDGEFWFTDLVAGDYTVSEAPEDFIPTTPVSTQVGLEPDVELVAFPGQAMLRPDQVEIVDTSLMFGNMPPSSIHGFKFEDVDRNGMYDPAVDLPWEDVWFALWGDTDGDGDDELVSGSTNANGEFWFTGLVPGDYTVSEMPPDGSTPTTPSSVTLTVGVGEELVAFAGQAMLLPGQTEVVVGSLLMFGNAREAGSIHGRKLEQRTVAWRNPAGTGGVWDLYDTSNAEPAAPFNPDFTNFFVNNGFSRADYDETRFSRHFGESFTGLPTNIVSASLRIGLKPLGLSTNDNLIIGAFTGSGRDSRSDARRIGGAGGWLPQSWDSTNFPNGTVLNVSLSTSVVAIMNDPLFQRLDVYVQDDTSVDFIDVCIRYQTYVGLDNWTVDLLDGSGHVVDTQQTMTMSGEPGHYWFDNLPAGNYTVRERPGNPLWWNIVSPQNGQHVVALHTDEHINGLNFINARSIQPWDACWIERPTGPPVEFFRALADDYQENFIDLFLVDGTEVINFDGLSGPLQRDTFADSHGVLLDNLDGRRLQGVEQEGGNMVQNLDGYDASYRPDGDDVFVVLPNHVEPLVISFDEPVSAVGSFIGTGKEGTIETITIEVFDSDGNLLNGSQGRVAIFSDDQNREGFWGFTAEHPIISRVSILNDNPIDFGNAAIIDDLQWARPAPPVTCDFNGDGVCDVTDIDALTTEIASGTHDPTYDLTGDGLVDQADLTQWLSDAGGLNLPSGNAYLLGDANLDGVVDALDFNRWNSNKFTSSSAWSQGDFNADGNVDVSDFAIWNGNKFTASDVAAAHSGRLDVAAPVNRPRFRLAGQADEDLRREQLEQELRLIEWFFADAADRADVAPFGG